MDKEDALLDSFEIKEETFRFQADDRISQSYRIFIPNGCDVNSNTRILVCVHGISRRSKEQIALLSHEARENNTIVIAPLFSKKHHPSYQRHLVGIDKYRSDEVLNNIITDVEKRFRLKINKFDLFGFSGGAQFAHRYALRYPEKISKLICCAAGWYTFPDYNDHFPYGLANDDEQIICSDIDKQLAYFLRIPITIVVGEHDKHIDQSLNRTKKVNKQQGFHRIERATRWANALLKQSKRLELEPQLRFIILPNCGHSFTESVLYGKLTDYIF